MFQDPVRKTELKNIGEFALIERLTKNIILQQPSTLKGVGDDAAAMHFEGREVLVSTDMLLEGIHFDLTYVPLKHLGYKAAVVNFSDIYAMNGEPTQLTVGLACSNRFPAEALEQLYEGILLACRQYGVDLVGGDTTSSRAGLIISLTAIGSAEPGAAVYRSGAQVNDLLVVSGDLGAAYAGLQILEREKAVFLEHPGATPDLDGYDYILERQLKPEARRDVIEYLREQKVRPTAMIDVSDGLSSEILHICKQSNVGCHLYEERIPIDPGTYNVARDLGIDPTVCALNGGEDYELLFTVNPKDYDLIKNSALLTVVGYIQDASAGTVMEDKSGGIHPITAQGWTAFNEGE